ncbi:MAG: hypothetical protein LBI33_08350 [Propionibacteriaceae bacterium]|jgi:predicted nucleic-acid-binding protein|nr:hypothetical protein [Propionibacteriaceae bacterium]
MSPTLDTNLLLRLTLRDVPDQYEAVRELVTRPRARYRVTNTAVNEMVHALQHHYGLTRPQTAAVVRALLSDSAIEADKGFLGSVIQCFVDHPAMSYTDCYLAEEARTSGNTPLLTFDRKLAAQHVAAELVVRT